MLKLSRVIICHFSALDHDMWYDQIDKYFYLSNMNFGDTICLSKLSDIITYTTHLLIEFKELVV